MREVGLLGLLATGGMGASAQVSGDVSVRLFSTRNVTALTLTPDGTGAAVRRCAACTPQVLNGTALISEGPDGLRVNGESLQHVWVDGQLRVQVNAASPLSAAGLWRIDSEHGALRVVLTVPRERYVMAVLSGEAAVDDPPAALDALAIVVRSFAVANAGKHRAEGYDFDDGTESQVAQFGPVVQRIRDAVQATAGETLWVGNARVAAYFSQNCGGMTEDASALWGGAKKPWLVAHTDSYCQRTPSQWHAEVSGDELRAALAAEGWKLAAPVTSLRVLTRTPGGRAARVEIISGAQTTTIAAQSFRLAIGRSLGWNRLRSDWYTVSYSGGRAVFEGRGYGHGVGLCQAGAHAFALEHHGDALGVARDILRFYFPGADIRVEAMDHGWQQREADGWTLSSVAPDDSVVGAGNAAWVQAQRLFHVGSLPHPVVRLYPETELFRQATGESGWTLGATRGANVSVQPGSVVAKHETMQALLLHEFLHVLVESEAGSGTPLWLREGIVEWLAGQRDVRPASLGKTIDAATLDSDLMHATNWRAAVAAHHAAGVMVARLIALYGASTVRGWLRSGLPADVTHAMLTR